jgi:hypothetical protein
VVVAHLRKFNIRLASYLDDWLAVNKTKMLLLKDRYQILSLLFHLGFIINKEKSQLVPMQTLNYLGSYWDLKKGLVFPSMERLEKLKTAVSNIQKGQCTARHFLVLLGMIASCLELIPNARLFMRPIQLHLLKKLEPYQNESVYKNSFNTSTDPGSELVLIGSEHWLGQIITERQLSNNTDHRCQWLRLGRSHEQLDMSRTVDFVRKNASYKLSGNVSSYVQSQTFSIKAEGQKCSSPIRQYNCLPIHQSAGGHEISPIMQYDYEPLATGPGEQYFAESCSYFGKEECVGGYTEQGESMSDRVVLEQDSGSKNCSSFGVIQ